MDSTKFRNYILGTIFYRYLSERTKDYMQEILKEDGLTYEQAFADDNYRPVVEQWSIEHLGYIIRPENLFDALVRKIVRPDGDADRFNVEDYERAVNELIGSTMGQASEAAFSGLFNDMKLQDPDLGDTVAARTSLIAKVIVKISEIDLKLADSQFDVLGTAYMILIGLFASDAGKKSGEFFTPTGPSKLVATLATVGLDEARTVGDCTCGSASMLLEVQKHLTTGRVGHFYGQENNATTYNLARMNMLMHGVDYQHFDIYKGDTLREDKYGDVKMTVQVCNPPYSLKYDGNPALLDDPRYSGAGKLPPKSHADYAFVEHMVYHMDDNDGRVAVLLPHGVLFRGGAEEVIRKYIVKDLNRLDAVIGLAPNLSRMPAGAEVQAQRQQRQRAVHRRQQGVQARQEPEHAGGHTHPKDRGGLQEPRGRGQVRPCGGHGGNRGERLEPEHPALCGHVRGRGACGPCCRARRPQAHREREEGRHRQGRVDAASAGVVRRVGYG
ncbi:type I restriction-modification system subunit M [Bifidobacterium longum subsp. longum]